MTPGALLSSGRIPSLKASEGWPGWGGGGRQDAGRTYVPLCARGRDSPPGTVYSCSSRKEGPCSSAELARGPEPCTAHERHLCVALLPCLHCTLFSRKLSGCFLRGSLFPWKPASGSGAGDSEVKALSPQLPSGGALVHLLSGQCCAQVTRCPCDGGVARHRHGGSDVACVSLGSGGRESEMDLEGLKLGCGRVVFLPEARGRDPVPSASSCSGPAGRGSLPLVTAVPVVTFPPPSPLRPPYQDPMTSRAPVSPGSLLQSPHWGGRPRVHRPGGEAVGAGEGPLPCRPHSTSGLVGAWLLLSPTASPRPACTPRKPSSCWGARGSLLSLSTCSPG